MRRACFRTSTGQFGTFCNYTIGNVVATQLFEAACVETAVADALDVGEAGPLGGWLNDAVCRHGRRYGRDALLERSTGRPLDPEPYLAHLDRRFGEVYELH